LTSLQELARAGNPDAHHDLGVLFYFDAATIDAGIASVSTAYQHWCIAAHRGHPISAFGAGCIEVSETGFKKLRVVPDRFEFAARNGVAEAAHAMDWIDRWGRLDVSVLRA